jgi:hypothetical protein
MTPSPPGPFKCDGSLVLGYLSIVELSMQDVFLQRHEVQSRTGKSCMFLLAVHAGDCLVLIYHYFCSVTQEAVVLVILLEVRKGRFELIKG